MKITILIPCYNEKKYILTVLENVNRQKKNYNLEIIVSDDCSDDGTLEILRENKKYYDRLLEGEKNLGKGAAIKRGLNHLNSDVTIIQDADLEYNPRDYEKLIKPFYEAKADVVYGSRFQGSSLKRVLYFRNRLANAAITFISNFFTNLNFTDIECGYKAFSTKILKNLNLQENSFTFEVETTMKIAKLNLKIFEVGISYEGRTTEEGKKIRFLDGVKAIMSIFKYKFLN